MYFGYCYCYTHATYDWFCGPGSQMSNIYLILFILLDTILCN